MKKIISYVLAGTLLGVVFYSSYRINMWLKMPPSNQNSTQHVQPIVLPETQIQTVSNVAQSDDQMIQQNIPEKINASDIQTTYQLGTAFYTIYRRHIRPVYIDNFPSDFAQNGGPELFMKVITALVLRENKEIKKDRTFLITLYEKLNQNIPWNKTETARFNALVIKYAVTEQKTPQTQMDELLKRVDIIPPSLAVAMAGVHTNWGKTALKSVFGQKEWIDGVYTEKQFDTLTEAVQSYMMELNTVPIYYPMRLNRQVYRNLRGSLGAKLINTVNNFMPENPHYTHQLEQAFQDKQLVDFDNAIIFE